MELNSIKNCNNIITSIDPGSIAEKAGISVGDRLVSINGRPVVDIIDYLFLSAEDAVVLEWITALGEPMRRKVDNPYYEPLGLEFDNPIMDEAKSCRNQCVFCFIDQMPKGMRETLYFKDDDSRLSFLQGNFVTLTNVSDSDLDRMIEYNISPINVSIHTTNPELRAKMLNNRFAGNVLERLKRLTDNRIEVNGQIVLCPDYNDGMHLDRTLSDLEPLYPGLQSIAVVPVGLTRFREGLAPMRMFTQEEARTIIGQVHAWQALFEERLGTKFVFLSDEFYVMADQLVPDEEAYEGYIQLENGVGLMRKFQTELEMCLEEMPNPLQAESAVKISIATGTSALSFMKDMAALIMSKMQIDIDVHWIQNNFFGPTITVAGLIVGQDLYEQLKDQDLGKALILPIVMMKSDERVFLDDMTVETLSEKLGVPIYITEIDGWQFVDLITSVIE